MERREQGAHFDTFSRERSPASKYVQEKEIERHLKNPIKALGGFCLKLVTPGFTGIPDRLILLPGGVVRFVETKRPGKTETRRQEYVHGQLRALGFTVYSTIDTVEKIKAVVAECAEAINR